ncbi:MAG: outer membrane protein beta-barrel protein [Sediminibacterium sp.]|nr:outer membrane protein beta-barrel protein [Sediminibacterium sp.]
MRTCLPNKLLICFTRSLFLYVCVCVSFYFVFNKPVNPPQRQYLICFMKKIILPVFIVLGCFWSGHAQIKVQLEAGGTLSSFRAGTDNANIYRATTSASANLNYHVAVMADIYTTGRFGFYTGISFDNRGASFLQTQYDNRDQRAISIQYLGIPAGISYELFTTKKISIRPTLGVYGAFALGGREKGVYYSSITNDYAVILNAIYVRSENTSQTLPTNVKPFDWGAQACLQAIAGRYSFSLQYSHGIKGVLTNPSLYDRQYYNSSIGLVFGYRL